MRRVSKTSVAALIAGLAACAGEPMSTDQLEVTVESVSPANGSVAAPTTVVSVTFSHAMIQGAEMLVLLHESSITGPVVSGSSVWSIDRRTLTFTPATTLRAATTYLLHLGPGLRAADGAGVNHQSCNMLGGRNVGPGMMSGGGVGSGMMTGAGWRTSDGTYGMFFTFTTS